MRYVYVVLFFYTSLFAFGVDVPEASVSNGRTAIIIFDKENGVEYEKIVADKRSYKIFTHPTNADKLYALLPESYILPQKNQTTFFKSLF